MLMESRSSAHGHEPQGSPLNPLKGFKEPLRGVSEIGGTPPNPPARGDGRPLWPPPPNLHRLGQVFRDLESDPFQQRLRLHPLQGDLAGLYAVSVTYAYRLTLTVRVEASEVVLLDSGTHDERYR